MKRLLMSYQFYGNRPSQDLTQTPVTADRPATARAFRATMLAIALIPVLSSAMLARLYALVAATALTLAVLRAGKNSSMMIPKRNARASGRSERVPRWTGQRLCNLIFMSITAVGGQTMKMMNTSLAPLLGRRCTNLFRLGPSRPHLEFFPDMFVVFLYPLPDPTPSPKHIILPIPDHNWTLCSCQL